jgi:uncharacterized protein (TIGR02246 family)
MGEFAGRRTGEPLEARIARLEDIEAIKALKARYAYYADHGYDADGMASLFVEDAVSNSGPFGTFRGREAIRAATEAFKKKIVWALHFMICPVVNVSDDGQTATGSWYLIQFATMVGPDGPGVPERRDAVVLSAVYNDTFVRENGEWRFKTVNIEFHQVSNLDEGWVRQQFRPD